MKQHPHTAQPAALSASNSTTLHWLQLSCAALSANVTTQLIQHFGDASAIHDASLQQLLQAGFTATTVKRLKAPNQEKLDTALRWAEKAENHLVSLQHGQYPALLRQIADPPPLLYVCGETSSLCYPQLAIVGARNATHSARSIARELATDISNAGLAVVSGLALGIDSEAHRGCLDGASATLAVAGSGLDLCYPASNRRLAALIPLNGALISEFPPGTAPIPRNFPRRNRIISGLSLGTLVVEASLRSGTLVTARLAMEQNREVFAVPGSIRNPLSKGCHELIRHGAKLVESATDVLEELNLSNLSDNFPTQSSQFQQASNLFSPTTENNSNSSLDTDCGQILDCLGYDPISVDILSKRCQLGLTDLMGVLLSLELDGQIKALSGGRYVRC